MVKEILVSDENYTSQEVIADAVKCLLEYHMRYENIRVEVGTFDNCREYGNTYRILGAKQDYTFCVYEHRNSDEICINGCPTTEIKSYGPYSGKDKWFSYACFSYDEHYQVAKTLCQFLLNCRDGEFSDTAKDLE